MTICWPAAPNIGVQALARLDLLLQLVLILRVLALSHGLGPDCCWPRHCRGYLGLQIQHHAPPEGKGRAHRQVGYHNLQCYLTHGLGPVPRSSHAYALWTMWTIIGAGRREARGKGGPVAWKTQPEASVAHTWHMHTPTVLRPSHVVWLNPSPY